MKKLLSIIIPTYNMEVLLDRCLTSLILEKKELRDKLDVIVVNDGSTDSSSEIAHRYAENYPEMFSVIDKSNGNYGSCINAALPYITGKYVRILDADDSYVTKNLPEYLAVLERQDVELVLSDYEIVDMDGNIISRPVYSFARRKVFSFASIKSEPFLAMHTVAYASEIFKRIKYHQTEGVSYTDLEWVFYPMSEVNNVYYYDKTIYRYLDGREGQTVDPSIRLKRLSHMEKGLWTQLSIFEKISPSNVAYGYMHGVIAYRTRLLYTWGLDRKADYDLMAFDNKLKRDYPRLYDEASKYTIPLGIGNFQLPIVKMWRKVKKRNGLYLFPSYDLHVIINRIKSLFIR